MAHVGGGQATEIERETEHGRAEWKVEVENAGVEHDVRIDATTGAVTRVDADDSDDSRSDDRDDDRDDSGSRDDDHDDSDDRGSDDD